MVGGILAQEDLTADYRSDASETFKPYIVDSALTMNMTDRNLRQR